MESKKQKVFVGSSNDLKPEREKLDKFLREYGYEPILWEDADHSITDVRFQDRMNEQIVASDMVIIMIKSRYGEYTEEEYEYSLKLVKQKKISRLLLFFLNTDTYNSDPDDLTKVLKLRSSLDKDMCIDVKDYNELENKLSSTIRKYIKSDDSQVLKLKPLNFKQKQDDYKEIIGRKWLLEELDKFVMKNPDSNIYWLKAGPGFGKSAIATKLYQEHPKVCGIHYVEHIIGDSKTIKGFLHTMIAQLRSKYEWYEKLIPNEIDEDNDKVFSDFIYDPFDSEQSEECWYILDGLDEAFDKNINELADFIDSRFSRLPKKFKLIVLGRAENTRLSYLNHTSSSLDLEQDEKKNNLIDCQIFIENKLKGITEEVFKDKDILAALLDKSNANMLYLTKFFEAEKKGFININDIDKFPDTLGGIYRAYFRRVTEDKRMYQEEYAPLLELIVSYAEPMPKLLVQRILNIDEYDLDNKIESFGDLIRCDDNNRLKLYDYSLYEWLEQESNRDYRIYSSRGNVLLSSFIGKLDSDNYLKEYIEFFYFNKRIVDYYMPDSHGTLDDYFEIISDIDTVKKINELMEIVNFFIETDTHKAKAIVDSLSNEVISLNMDHELELELATDVMLKKAKVYDLLSLESLDIKEEALGLLDSSYDQSDSLTKNYLDFLMTFSHELDRQDAKKEALKQKKRALEIVEKNYYLHNKIWYMHYVKILITLAHSYEFEDGVRMEIKFKNAIDHKLKALDILNENNNADLKWHKMHMKVLSGLSVTYKKRAKYLFNGHKSDKKIVEYAKKSYDYAIEGYKKCSSSQEDSNSWNEQCLKLYITVSSAYLLVDQIMDDRTIDKKEKLEHKALKILESALEDSISLYRKDKSRWAPLSIFIYRGIMNYYMEWDLNKKKLNEYYSKTCGLFDELYEQNKDKFIIEYLEFLNWTKVSYKKLKDTEKALEVEADISELIDKEASRGSEIWGDKYFWQARKEIESINNGDKSLSGEEKEKRLLVVKNRKDEALKILYKINPERWFKSIRDSGILTFADKLEYFESFFDVNKNDNIQIFAHILFLYINKHKEDGEDMLLRIVMVAEQNMEAIDHKYSEERDVAKKRTYFLLLNNLSTAYLRLNPPRPRKAYHYTNIVWRHIVKDEFSDKSWEKYVQICLNNKKEIENLLGKDIFNVDIKIPVRQMPPSKDSDEKNIEYISKLLGLDIEKTIQLALKSPVTLQKDLDKDTRLKKPQSLGVINYIKSLKNIDEPYNFASTVKTQNAKDYNVGSTYLCEVQNIIKDGVFLKFTNGRVGLLPINCIKDDFILDIYSLYSIGESTSAVLISKSDKGFVFATQEYMKNKMSLHQIAKKLDVSKKDLLSALDYSIDEDKIFDMEEAEKILQGEVYSSLAKPTLTKDIQAQTIDLIAKKTQLSIGEAIELALQSPVVLPAILTADTKLKKPQALGVIKFIENSQSKEHATIGSNIEEQALDLKIPPKELTIHEIAQEVGWEIENVIAFAKDSGIPLPKSELTSNGKLKEPQARGLINKIFQKNDFRILS